MQIQLLVPSQNQKKLSVQVARDETVATFREMVAKLVKVPENSFLLIAFGKIMLDQSAEKNAARLFSTYRIRHKTCVLVHIYHTAADTTPTTKPKTAAESKTTTRATRATRRKMTVTQSKQHTKLKTITTRRISIATTATTKTPSQRRIIRDNNVLTKPFGDFQCSVCENNEKLKKCLECGCTKCLYKTGDPLICDQCDSYWHMECAGLRRMPSDQYWFCPDCINQDTKVIIGKGKAVNEQSLSKNRIYIRDVDCVIVPPHHIGKIPGIYCGQSWEYRSLVHDWGIHRATVPSVAGSSYTGAVSLVLSGGLKRDKDDGYEFVFSVGGGDLKTRHYTRIEGQMTQDQQLTRYNKALAITCNARFNDKEGAKAIDWRKSQPIRVCRASNRKSTHPMYAPEKGIRYDGLYKIVKYWPHRDKKTGFLIWKFLFRRDDQESPPWMSHGKQMISKRGIRMIKSQQETTEKLVRYLIPNRIEQLIKKDTKSKRLWDQIKKMEFWSEYEFLHYLFDTAVTCSSSVCSKPIKDPITAPCGHICCLKCLTTSKTEYCFTCRSPLPPINSLQKNDTLTRILQKLNWAYNTSPDKVALPSKTAAEQDLLKGVATKTEDNNDLADYSYLLHPEIKQEPMDYSTLVTVASSANTTVTTRKRARIFIEYLGGSSSPAVGQQQQQRKKRRV